MFYVDSKASIQTDEILDVIESVHPNTDSADYICVLERLAAGQNVASIPKKRCQCKISFETNKDVPKRLIGVYFVPIDDWQFTRCNGIADRRCITIVKKSFVFFLNLDFNSRVQEVQTLFWFCCF